MASDVNQILNDIADQLDAQSTSVPVGHTTQQWVDAMHTIAEVIRSVVNK